MGNAGVAFGAMRALVALSNKQLAEYIWYFLRENGAGMVQQVHHSNDALKRIQQENFTHLFVGHHLEDIGGSEFTKFVRMANGPLAKAEILMIISEPDREKIVTARDSGVSEILTLPLTGKQLKQRLNHSAGNSRDFIRSNAYLGPCRRRSFNPNFKGRERRINVEYLQSLKKQKQQVAV